jgi:hypothetical protein
MGNFPQSDPQYAQYANLPLIGNAGGQTAPPYDPHQGQRRDYPPATYGSNAEPAYPPSQSQPSQERIHFPQSGDGSQGGLSAIASEATVSRLFSVGSTVQLSNPPRYGVVQWIGHLPEIQGSIAGLELVS